MCMAPPLTEVAPVGVDGGARGRSSEGTGGDVGHGCAEWLVTGRLGGGWRGQDAKIGQGQGRAKRYAQYHFEDMSVLKRIMVRHVC